MVKKLSELVLDYGSKYRVSKMVRDNKLYKVDAGVYADRPDVPEVEILQAKYPNAVLTLNSAYYYYGLSDEIPEAYYLATERNSRQITDPRAVHLRVPCGTGQIGLIETSMLGDHIRIYDRERLLIETMRYRTKLPYDLYREVIDGFRDMRHELYGAKIDDYLKEFPRRTALMDHIRREIW